MNHDEPHSFDSEPPTPSREQLLECLEDEFQVPVPSCGRPRRRELHDDSFVDRAAIWLEFLARWYRTILCVFICSLFSLQFLTYRLNHLVAFLATSLLLNLAVFAGGIVTAFLALYLTGRYFDIKRKPENAVSWSSSDADLTENEPGDSGVNTNDPDTSWDLPATTTSTTRSTNEDCPNRRSAVAQQSFGRSTSEPKTSSEPKPIQFSKSSSTSPEPLKRHGTLASLPFFAKSSFSRGQPPQPASLRTSLRKKPTTEAYEGDNSDLAEYGLDPRSLWFTHFIRHLFVEWKDSDKCRNGIRKKVEQEISELLSKQTRFINRDISVADIVKSIAIHQIEIGEVSPDLTNFAHCYNDENRTCFELDFSYSDPDKKGTGYCEIEVDFVRLQRTMRFRLQLNFLEGRVKVCLERDPYSFWWFSFISDPKIDLQIRQYPLNDNNALVKWFRDEFLVNRIRTIIKKHHKLPNYKVRTRPLMPDTSVNNVANSKSNNMQMLGDVLPVYNIVEVSLLDYSRFPIEFDRVSPEAGCFVKYTIELTSIDHELSQNSKEAFEIIDKTEMGETPNQSQSSASQRLPQTEVGVDLCPADNLAYPTEHSPSHTSTPEMSSNESLATINSPTMEFTSMDVSPRVPERSPHRTITMLRKVAPSLRRRKGQSVKHHGPPSDAEDNRSNLDTRSLDIDLGSDTNTALAIEALDQLSSIRDASRIANNFGHVATRVTDDIDEPSTPPAAVPKFESELRIPTISANLGRIKSWAQTHMLPFSPEKSGQFVRITFHSQKHKTKEITPIGQIDIPLENILAMVRPINSRTATRRFRVSKPPNYKVAKEFQTWRKLNATQQRRFSEGFCYGDVCLKFRLTSVKENASKATPPVQFSNAVAESESAVEIGIKDLDKEMRHDFEPFRLGPMEVGKHVCAFCGKRMFNPKAANQRRCRHCQVAIHERCEASMYDVACSERREKLEHVQTEQENEERIVRAMASSLEPTLTHSLQSDSEIYSTATAVLSTTPSLYQLCNSFSDTSKMDKFAYVGKFLKKEFIEHNLTNSQEKYAFIQHEIEKMVEEDKKRQAQMAMENGIGDPAQESAVNDNLAILQLFGIHYNQ